MKYYILFLSVVLLGSFSGSEARNDLFAWIPNLIPVIAPIFAPIQNVEIRNLNLCWFEALVPFHDEWTSILGLDIPKVPVELRTLDNRNIALSYATYQFSMTRFPGQANSWAQVLSSLGLPLNETRDTTTIAGIGNAATDGVIEFCKEDGWNSEGTLTQEYRRQFFQDYTNFQPTNQDGELEHKDDWLPLDESFGGRFLTQKFIAAQAPYATTFGIQFTEDDDQYQLAGPTAFFDSSYEKYFAQAQRAVELQANLTDEQKLIADFFDDKIESLGNTLLFFGTAIFPEWEIDDWVKYDLLAHMAQVDAAIVTWKEKTKFNYVRPENAIQFLFKDEEIPGYGGYGEGVVTMMGQDWKSYIPTGPHPEYPSGSTCFCSSLAGAMRLYFDRGDALGFGFSVAPGMSKREPGIVPAEQVNVGFPTWTDFVDSCSISRQWAGVHFDESVDDSVKTLCAQVGEASYHRLMPYFGEAEGDTSPWVVKPNEFLNRSNNGKSKGKGKGKGKGKKGKGNKRTSRGLRRSE